MPTTADFLDRYGDQTFRHSEELLAGIRAGICELFEASKEGEAAPTHQLLETYRKRADWLRPAAAAGTGWNLANPSELLADMEALIAELESRTENHAQEPCGFWGFTLAPRYMFSVFDAPTSGSVLGCLRIVLPDDRFAKRKSSPAASTASMGGGLAINFIPRGMKCR